MKIKSMNFCPRNRQNSSICMYNVYLIYSTCTGTCMHIRIYMLFLSQIAIDGYDFCTAACKAIKLLLRNILT